jgi:hypothetical protein
VREPDEGDDAARLAGDLLQRFLGRADEARSQQQILGWVGGDGELGQEHEVGLCASRFRDRLQDARAVAVEVPDGGVDLRERESHSVLDYQSKTSRQRLRWRLEAVAAVLARPFSDASGSR